NAVAAHLGFAAVRVEHAHAHVGPLGRADEDQPVAADAEVAVADFSAQASRVARRRIAHAIHVDAIVGPAVHFGEAHGDIRPSSWLWRQSRLATTGESIPGGGRLNPDGNGGMVSTARVWQRSRQLSAISYQPGGWNDAKAQESPCILLSSCV